MWKASSANSFQYPQRIDEQWNLSPQEFTTKHLVTFSILNGSMSNGTEEVSDWVDGLMNFQYPQRIDEQWNVAGHFAAGDAPGLSVSSTDR